MSSRAYDIVIMGDFRFPGGAASGPAEQIRAQAAAGYRTALIQVKGPVLKYPHPFNPNIRRCLDAGMAELVDPDTPVSAPLLLAFHPQIFTHLPHRPLNVSADTKILVASHPLVDGAGDPYYDWVTINENAQEALGGGVEWAPLGPLVRAPVPELPDAPPLYKEDWLEIVDLDDWRVPRNGFVDTRPVIGRHSRPDPLKWPEDPTDILAAYPDDPACRVRILGGGPFLNEIIGQTPANWEMLPFNSVDPRTFLGSIDYFVYYHHSRWVEAFGRVLIEAIGSGTIAVLPPHFEVLCGEAALYGEPGDVKDIISQTYEDFGTARAHIEKAHEIVHQRFSSSAHLRRLENMIGPPKKPVAVAAPKPAEPKPRRVLFMTSNGIGMGHLNRMLAIARRCPPGVEPVFVTMSQAMRVVEEFGFLAEFIPFHTYLRCDMVGWNHFLRHEINEIVSFYDPSVLVFDGNVAYGGLVSALNDNPSCLGLWCRRAMWRPGAQAEENIKRETAFHGVIEPGEVAAAYDAGLTTQYRDKTRQVAPIRFLDDDEILSREEAAEALGLDPNRPAVLLQLGSGNNYDYNEMRKLIIAKLRDVPGLQVAFADWLISNDTVPLPDDVVRLKLYPLGKYIAAFDFVVGAAGYNSFHELLATGTPTLFMPNENPMMDEQLIRAQFAQRNGLGLCVRTREVYKIEPYLQKLLDPGFREEVRARCAELDHSNGAHETAEFVGELVHSVRADRVLREFWT